jgi:UDP-N-acetylglucosamine 2-epimerase (non-hydrolysing)/GDP/UDP-N,N'-diacetylbacillosamine 2-epimerase (hydrolysing)
VTGTREGPAERRRRIAVATGSRAEYGLLSWLMREIASDAELELQVIVTGMHLSPQFGSTYLQIEADGFEIDAKVESLLSSDSPVGIAKSIALGVSGFADVLARLQPDILVLLGDRFEMLAAAQAAMVVPVAIAHIGGGDNAEATYDNLIRHAITKMSHLHFVTHERAARRVVQLGEDPALVHNVGALVVDGVRGTRWLDRSELADALGTTVPAKPLLVTYHPTTTDVQDAEAEFGQLLRALERLMDDGYTPLFTAPNCDNNSFGVRRMLDEFTASHPSSRLFESLGARVYLSLMRHCALVVGNSSSGIYEAPLLSIPTLDVGNRQKGRARGGSVHATGGSAEDIYRAARDAIEQPGSFADYPYGADEPVAARIKRILKETPLQGLTYKRFHDLPR